MVSNELSADTASTASEIVWWKHGVVYQIYPRSFQDSNGDGIGDLQGIIDRLDYLNDGTPESLGIHAIWLSPFYPSPMADFGYDVADYNDVDPMFGDLETFDRLVAEAHKRGMKIIIDYVPNHSSSEHPWFLESRSSRDNPKRDWYIWRDAKPDGTPPNNWGSWFGGSAWEWDETTGQYYLHLFDKGQPDLNWRNPEVYSAMMDVLKFWLDRGVDGFRMDVVHFILKHPDLLDNPIREGITVDPQALDFFMYQEHRYDIAQPEVHAINRDFRRLLDSYGETVAVGEIFMEDIHEWAKYYGDAEGAEFHVPFNFRLMELKKWDATAFRTDVELMESAIPDHAWPNYVLGNHDQKRLATRYGARNARTAGMLLLTLRGTPTLYNGDELIMEEGKIPLSKIQDPQGVNLGAERSRDGCRTPMQWDASENAGFSTVEPWLPVSDDYQTRNVAVQKGDPRSSLNFYRKLLSLRNGSPALTLGSYRALEAPEDTYVYVRAYGNEIKLVALNFSDEPKTIDLSRAGNIVLSTEMDREGALNGSTLDLRPNEGVLIELLPVE
jgi:alpha-glucosidase